MDRETKTVNIGEKEIILKSYLTAGEVAEIRKLNIKDQSSAEEQIEAEKKLIELGVISIGGEKENIYDKCSNMEFDHYTELLKELSQLITKKKS